MASSKSPYPPTLQSTLAPPTPPYKCPSCPILQRELASANERIAQACKTTWDSAQTEMETMEEQMNEQIRAVRQEKNSEVAYVKRRHETEVTELEDALDEADASNEAMKRTVDKYYGRLLAYDDEMRQAVDAVEAWKQKAEMWRGKAERRDERLRRADARIRELEDEAEAAKLQSAAERLGFQEGLANILPALRKD